MSRFGDDVRGTTHDHLSPHRMKAFEPFLDDRHVARSDLEQAVATKRATAAALKILRLRAHHGREEFVCLIEVEIG